LHEGAVGLIDQPLRLRGDGVEYQRALARAGDAREHRQPSLRDLDADVLEVVHPRALHPDQLVAVGFVQRAGPHATLRCFASRVRNWAQLTAFFTCAAASSRGPWCEVTLRVTMLYEGTRLQRGQAGRRHSPTRALPPNRRIPQWPFRGLTTRAGRITPLTG